jgi:TATA-box binding protein (TBP) (component of TFIID and TFIIIB)
VIVGTHSLPQSYQAAHRLRLLLHSNGESTKFEQFRLVNMVYSDELDGKAGQGIDIAGMHRDHQDKTDYVPEAFPGLKLSTDRAQLRIFDPGKFVAMGVIRSGHVKRIFRDAKQMAKEYPDYDLPAKNKRYAYRKEKNKRALVDIIAQKMGHETDTDLEDGGDRMLC